MPRAILILAALASTAAADPAPVLLVTEPAALADLEARIGTIGVHFNGTAATDNATLARDPGYASIATAIERDLDDIRAKDPKLAVGMRTIHRLFDRRWLRAATARFELAGVAGRIDRRPFHASGCGETRLVYRLAYRTRSRGTEITSRLPMTINVVYRVPGDDCEAAARAWLVPASTPPGALGKVLAAEGRPLHSSALSREHLRSIEVNLQSVRWPSTIRPDMAGHAEYLMRVFHRDARGRFTAAPLENTPDVERLARDPKLRAELLAHLRAPATLDAVDAGTVLLPEKFLARRVETFAPRGSARRANQPFTRLFRERELEGLDLAGRRRIRSPRALLRRLDDLSCAGCHQGRSIAGFHLLGVDPDDTAPGNAINVAASPHLTRDLPRRTRYVLALARGEDAGDARPFSERADDHEGGYGSHCGLGDEGFADWTCAPGLTCTPVNADPAPLIGQCFPSERLVGDPCEYGTMKPHDDPHKDRVVGVREHACRRGLCETNDVGFPGGMCAVSCDDLGADGACGAIAILQGFNNCIARRQPFAKCLAEHVRPAGLRRCDDATPCRDDYICARTPAGEGTCVPPYFLFQLRVDGHPAP